MWLGTMGWAMLVLMGLSTAALWAVVFLLVRQLLPGADTPRGRGTPVDAASRPLSRKP